MNAGKIILLGIALVAGGAAFFLVASGDDDQPISQVVPVANEVETVRVLVADAEFSRGDRLDPASTKWIKWPKKGLPEEFVTEDNKEFFDSLGQTVSRTTIVPGEPITEAKLIRSDDRSMMAALLTPGFRAVSIDVTQRTSASGFVLPGDKVDIYATTDDESSDNGEVKTALLLADIRVIAVDQQIDQNGSGAIVGRTVTLELAPSQIELFLNAREAARLNLALRSAFKPEGAVEIEQEVKPADVLVVRYGQS